MVVDTSTGLRFRLRLWYCYNGCKCTKRWRRCRSYADLVRWQSLEVAPFGCGTQVSNAVELCSAHVALDGRLALAFATERYQAWSKAFDIQRTSTANTASNSEHVAHARKQTKSMLSLSAWDQNFVSKLGKLLNVPLSHCLARCEQKILDFGARRFRLDDQEFATLLGGIQKMPFLELETAGFDSLEWLPQCSFWGPSLPLGRLLAWLIGWLAGRSWTKYSPKGPPKGSDRGKTLKGEL